MSATLTRRMSVTNGRCGVVHVVQDQRTLCGRDAALMLTLSGMAAWEVIGWEAAAQGPCMRCDAKLAKLPRVAPITVDSTPAGILRAILAANSTDAHGLVNVLVKYLRRTLTAAYGAVAAEHVHTVIMNSLEASDESIAYGLESVQYSRTEQVTVSDLAVGDTVSTDVGPVLLVKDNGARGLLSVRNFTGRILSVPSVPDHCTWVLRTNVADRRPVDHWTVQGTSARLFHRYAV